MLASQRVCEMDTLYYSRISYARTIAENSNLTLVEEEEIDMPRTERGRIYVPKYNPRWNEDSDESISWWGKFLHEIYHNDTRYKNNKIFDILEKNKKDLTRLLALCNNMLEDHRIEYTEYGEYPGRDRIMDSLRTNMFRKYLASIEDNISTGSPKVDALFWLQWECFKEWVVDIPYRDTKNDLTSEAQECVSKIAKYVPSIFALKSAEESWILAKKICDDLVDDSPKVHPEGTEVKPGEGKEDKDDVEYDKYLLDCHMKELETKKDDEEKKPGERRHHPHMPAPMRELQAVGHSAAYKYHIESNTHIEGLAGQIKRYLLVKVRNKTVNSQKTGRIDAGSLWKAVVYSTSSVGQKVFQKDTEHMNLDTAVSLLVDTSGSMTGIKYIHAAAAATTLNEVFGKIGIKTRITGFTDDSTDTWTYVHKNYSEKVSKDTLIERLSQAGSQNMNGNADGENILWEYAKLVSRPEARKIMIVLSDGYPSTGKGTAGDIWKFTEDAVKGIEKDGLVEIIGIGIMDNSVENFYKNFKVLNNSSMIESTLLEILKEHVIHA